MLKEFQNRVFVPLTKEAFEWFLKGKDWEVRKLNVGQYNLKNIKVGKTVELRMGYQPGQSIWGRVSEVKTFDNAFQLLKEVFYKNIIPSAKNEIEAIKFIEKYVGNDKTIIAFRVDQQNSV